MKPKRFAVIAAGALLAAGAGCAKKEIVKNEEAAPEEMRAGVSSSEPAPREESLPEVRAYVDEQRLPERQTRFEAAERVGAVYFEFDSHLLTGEARETLARNAESLKNGKDRVVIEGHCDERGSDDYNLALGDRRANAAKDFLVTLGVPEERLGTVSYGKELPADPGHGDEAWAKNRRSAFVVDGE
jgi:peptidoglycan-associated lipoprotein